MYLSCAGHCPTRTLHVLCRWSNSSCIFSLYFILFENENEIKSNTKSILFLMIFFFFRKAHVKMLLKSFVQCVNLDFGNESRNRIKIQTEIKWEEKNQALFTYLGFRSGLASNTERVNRKNTTNYFLQSNIFRRNKTVKIQCRRKQSLSWRINRVKLLSTSSSGSVTPHRFHIAKAHSVRFTRAYKREERRSGKVDFGRIFSSILACQMITYRTIKKKNVIRRSWFFLNCSFNELW